jgi:hypothetical protein
MVEDHLTGGTIEDAQLEIEDLNFSKGAVTRALRVHDAGFLSPVTACAATDHFTDSSSDKPATKDEYDFVIGIGKGRVSKLIIFKLTTIIYQDFGTRYSDCSYASTLDGKIYSIGNR